MDINKLVVGKKYNLYLNNNIKGECNFISCDPTEAGSIRIRIYKNFISFGLLVDDTGGNAQFKFASKLANLLFEDNKDYKIAKLMYSDYFRLEELQ